MNAPLKPWVPPTRRTCRPTFFDGHGGSGVEPRTRTARYSTAPLTVAAEHLKGIADGKIPAPITTSPSAGMRLST